MLPWASSRPISLVRCPQGRAKKCFFQKHAAGSFGEPVKQVVIREKDGSSEPYLFIESGDALSVNTAAAVTSGKVINIHSDHAQF